MCVFYEQREEEQKQAEKAVIQLREKIESLKKQKEQQEMPVPSPATTNETSKGTVIVPTKPETTQQDRIRDKILENLQALGKLTTGEDDLIFEGTKFVLPSNLQGNIGAAVKYLRDWEEAQSARFNFNRVFNYRPNDGANAFQEAMKKMWGSAGVGRAIQTMFGDIPPEYRTINISPTQTAQVPWNRVSFSPLEADFYLLADQNEYGQVFQLMVEAPRKYRAHIEAFFALVEEELKTNSIYRGKAITGAQEPQFIDTSNVDPSRVIYSADVMVQFETNMWSLLRYSEKMRENRIPLKRAVLVEGPYGTGKTLGGLLTAKEAVENGWTFIQARPGKDDLREVLNTAQLYAPAVVWYEDIDTVADGRDYKSISSLLDALDGVTNKGVEILAGFTTNFVDRIHKGVLRPGRLDAVISIQGLDARGFEQLVKVTVPAAVLAPDVDYERVAEAFAGMVPAFAKEAIDRSLRYSMTRNGGVPGTITTDDLVNAANGLRPQLALMERAAEGAQRPTLDVAMTDTMNRMLNDTMVVRDGGNRFGTLKVTNGGEKKG